MGTTKSSLGTGGGRYVWVAAVEGYADLLCSGHAAAVLTAWAATPFTGALVGLSVQATLEQKIDPWSTDLEPSEMTLIVTPGAKDQFGIDINKGGAGTESYLEVAIDCNDTTLTPTDSSQFDASGTVYIGTERMTHAANAGGDLTGVTRGLFFPCDTAAGTNVMGRAHALPTIDYDVRQKPIISTVCRDWIGKDVAVHLHRELDGVLDTKAESIRVFYGSIEAIEDTVEGNAILSLVCIKERLNRAVLMNDQWRALVQDGIKLYPGTYWRVSTTQSIAGEGITAIHSDPINIVTGAGAGEIEAGYYSASEIAGFMSDWLNADGSLTGDWAVFVSTTGNFTIRWTPPAGYLIMAIHLKAGQRTLDSLGFPQSVPVEYNYDTVDSEQTNDYPVVLTSPNTVAEARAVIKDGETLTLKAGARGAWWNNQPWFPSDIGGETAAGENWGVLQVGNDLLLGKYVSATSISNIKLLTDYTKHMSGWSGADHETVVRFGEDAQIEAKQIAMISGSLKDIIARLFLSTGTAAYNDATYDAWPAQLGAAIPQEICGAAFISSLTGLSESTGNGDLVLVIDKPTRLWDCIACDLLLRAAWLVWRDGGLVFTTAVTPHSSIASYTWTDSDKASAEPADTQRTIARTDDSNLRNVLKLSLNRAALTSDEYLDTIEVRFTRSIQTYGERVQTIECRNSFGSYADSGDAVERLTWDLVERVVPLYGVPLKRMKRPISPAYFQGVVPGDVALIDDPHMRDPATGIRSGVYDKPALIISHMHSFGGGGEDSVGEVEVLYQDLDRAAIYSPSAEVTGYADSGANGLFDVTTHKYSGASDLEDLQHFQDNDTITVVERDPADPSAPDTLSTTVLGTPAEGSDQIATDDQFPGYDAGKEYYIVSQTYSTATATQAADCYHADSDDARVENERGPYLYAASPPGTFTGLDGTQLAERHANMMFADGSPVSTGAAWALAINANNLGSYATAIHAPLILQAAVSRTLTTYALMASWPVCLGPCLYPGGMTRHLYVSPLLKTDDADWAAYARVTLSRWRPSGSSLVGVTFAGPYKQLTFETNSITYVTPTVQSMTPASPVVYPNGYGWISLELKVEEEHYNTTSCWGIPKFWMGPLVSA